MILKSIGVLSCGKMMGIVYAILGLVVGGFFALFSLAGVAFQQAPDGNARMMPFMAFGAAAVVILSILYGIIGFIGGIILALLYNAVASVVGGLELDFQSNQPHQ